MRISLQPPDGHDWIEYMLEATHTERMVTLHYAKWIQTRQDRLTRILQDAFADKPRPKVVVMTAGRP